MKKILFVVDEKKMGGVSILLEDMFKLVNFNNFEVDLLVLHNNGEMFGNVPSNINIIYGPSYFDSIDLPIKEIIKKKNLYLLFRKFQNVFEMKTGLIENRIKKIRRKTLPKQYDVEIAFKDGFTALFTGFGNSKKKIHWLHYEYTTVNPNGNYMGLFNRILPTFDNIVAVSKGVMDAFNKHYHLENKTVVIANIINGEKIINKATEISDVALNENELNIVSVGRLHPMKGYDRLFDALHQLKTENLTSNLKFRLYGTGPESENLKNKLQELNLSDVVTMYGQVMNPYKYIKGSDLFILSSVYEPFGLVIVEAMILGVPVMATNNAATGVLIANDVNGLIVDNSTEGIYSGLKKLILNKPKINHYKENLVSYKYDNDEIINKIEILLGDTNGEN